MVKSENKTMKRTSIKNLFIIGNGFDIDHGLPTKYKNFREFIINKYNVIEDEYYPVPMSTTYPDGEEKYDENEVAAYLVKVLDQITGGDWSDFESFLGDDFTQMLYEDCFVVPYDENEKEMRHAVYNNEDQSSQMKNCCVLIKDFFARWIINYYKDFNYRTSKLLGNKSAYFKENINSVLSEGNGYLVFNYTMSLEKIYGINVDEVCHIHGDVYCPKEEIIVGHGETNHVSENSYYLGTEYNLDELKSSLYKDTEEAFYKNKDFFERINDELETIHSFGFSFSDVDMFYIEKIAEKVTPQKVCWYINNYDNNERKENSKKGQNMEMKIKRIKDLGFDVRVDTRW